MKLSKETLALLDDIEARIDPETEEDYIGQWRDFLYDRFDGEIFMPVRKKLSKPMTEIPVIDNINDALESCENMLRHQLAGVSNALAGKRGNLCVRANYGTGILSSLFGAEIFVMPRHTNTLPTTRAFNDTELIREKVEAGIPDLMTGFGKNVFEFGEFCAEVFEKYPKIKKYVTVYHPDLQGPLDICELLWGGEIFYAMYDEPELVHAMLRLVTDTYTEFIEKWFKMYPPSEEMNLHWGFLWHRGAIMLRNDSAMNLQPDFYREFAAPYDGELLKKYGGAVHFCGRGDHYIGILSELPGLYGVQMSQPQFNDMEIIFQNTVDKGIKLLAFNKNAAEEHLARRGSFNHNLSV